MSAKEDFFAFVETAGEPYTRVVSAPEPRPGAREPWPPRRSVRTWRSHVDLAPIERAIAALPPFSGPLRPDVHAVLVSPDADPALHRRFGDVYGAAPAYVCFAMDTPAFGRLTEDEYVDLHVALGHAAQLLWLSLLRVGLGCVPYGRVEGGRRYDLAPSGLRPLFTLAVGVPSEGATQG
ncbi:nitroreductase family protein [Microbacterium sp. NPDC055599]